MNWWKPSTWFERREAPFTDTVTAALLAEASGTSTSTATATAALEACAALYAAGFAAARVEAPPMIVPALTASFRALLARNLIRRGADLHLIEVDGGMVKLCPVATWDVRGGDDPASWYVRADLYGPSATRAVVRPHAGFVHTRYAVDPARPWRGVGPLQWASATGKLAGRLEAGLADEASAGAALLLPVPQDGGDGSDEDDPLKQLKSDIAKAKGKPVLVETTAAAWGTGQGAAPRRDWQPARLGPDWPDVLNKTRRETAEAVAGACNVPAVLLDPRAEGTSQREGLRRFAHIGLEPLARLAEAELSEKLAGPVSFDFRPLYASDLAGKARALGIMVKAGMDLDEALMKTGFEG